MRDKSASSLEVYRTQRDTEEDPSLALVEMFRKRKLALEGKIPRRSFAVVAPFCHGTDEGIPSHHRKFLADPKKLLLHAFDIL